MALYCNSVIVCAIIDVRFPGSYPRGDITQNKNVHVLKCSQLVHTFWILPLMGVNIAIMAVANFVNFYSNDCFVLQRIPTQLRSSKQQLGPIRVRLA